MKLKLTDAGRAKLVNLPNTGTNSVLVAQIGLTSAAFSPSPGLTALPGEFKRLSTFGGQAVSDDTIHVTIRDDSADTYPLRGFGLYLADGTLFATFGQAEPIMEKASVSMLLLATDIQFVDASIDPLQIEFGSTEFLNPPATTEVQGVVELATNAESEDGADTQRAVTPRGLRAFVDKRFGANAPTSFAKNLLALATASAFRAALEIKSAALKDTGHGNGLDADTLDGKHASDFALAGDFATVGHKHVIADVTGLQAALDGKAVKGMNNFTDQQFVGGSAPLVGFGSAGAEQSFIGGWANAGIWRVYNADRTASGELIIKHGDAPRWNGAAMWHAGNFAPDTKMDKAGGTFTGAVTIKDTSLRVSGWGNTATDGVIYFGSGESYLFKSGNAFSIKNAEGGFTALLSSGGSIWTSGNFDPGSKLNVTGGTVNGWLTIRAAGPTQPAIRFVNADMNGASRTVLQSVVGDGSAFAELHQVSNGFIWYNNVVGETARLDNLGNFRAATLRAFGGAYATQVRLVERGWNNQVGRWVDVLESDGSMSLYAYDSGGGSPTQMLEYRAVPAGGGNYLSLNGELRVRGRTAAIWFNDRNLTKDWAWYAQEGMARLNLAGSGDRVFVTEWGALSTTGGFDFGSSIKLKDIDGPMPYGLAVVERMELAAGHYKPEYNDDGRRRLFFVAEQLAELVPEAVDLEGVEFNGERVPSIKLDQLLPVMAKAIQELAAEVREMKAAR